jgi:ribosome-associated protein
MTTETAAKKDTQKLQRAIVDGLEDVKAQDIQVYNTEHLSPLFERVIIATGSSNRQTKALAASVRDAVREAGFTKPRIEGEDNGEWIIVDCGAAVAHIMQPAIRQYYHLEEIWGDKPVRLKFGAPNPMGAPMKEPSKAAKAPGKKEAEPKTTLRRSSAAKTAIKAAEQAAKPKSTKPKAPAKRPGAKTAIKTVVVGKKTAASKPAAPRSGAKTGAKPAAPRSAPKKAPARKA